MTATTAPLVYQGFIAKALGMSWAEAREFVEAQGFKTYPRGKSPRTWAMASGDWKRLAKEIGATTPEIAEAMLQNSMARADRALAHLTRSGRRRRVRGSR